MSNMFLKEYLIKHLYPTREERLEQDVLINTHHIQRDGKVEGDYFIRLGYTPELLNECPDKTVTIVIKVLNENIRIKLETVLNTIKIETINNINLLKEILIKHLYPTREERLEQDVIITVVNGTSDKSILESKYDLFIGTWGEGGLFKLSTTFDYAGSICVKVNNKDMYDKVKNVLENMKNDCSRNMAVTPSLTKSFLKDYLIKHLYPTREERLEQDVLIVKEDENPDYYMTYWGDAGHIDKIKKTSCVWPIKILNENIRQRFESSFDIIKQKINEHPTLNIGTGGSKRIKEIPMKEVLIDILYDDDPSFSEYEDFDYPEVRKPVHVERAVHDKPLIPVEYREEIVKTPKEETKVAAVALF